MYSVVEDAKESLLLAFMLLEERGESEQYLYLFAPELYSERYNVDDEGLISKMTHINELRVRRDWSLSEVSKKCFKFHFISSYFYCFVVTGMMAEWEYDEIIELVCTDLGLFVDDARYLDS